MELFFRRTGIFLITLILLICFFKVNGFFSNKKSEIIRSDGFGYYSYLPAIFIYKDYAQSFLKEKSPKYYVNHGVPEYMQTVYDKPVNKYFFGTAVLMYPFFIIAHWLSIVFHQPPDGYSLFYQYLIGLAAIFYVFVGLYFCNRLLRLYNATTFQSLLICSLIVFGTNLYYYVSDEPSMSHAYSFCAIAAFLFYAKSLFEFSDKKYIIPLFIALGFITILRPFNLIILLAVPFLAGSIGKLKEAFVLLFANYRQTIIGIFVSSFIVSLQMLIWYKQTGHFIVYSYTYEKFYFDKPNFMNVLFSYKKGLFVYTPLLFLSLGGFFYLFQKRKFSAITILLFFIITVYVMSCWHQWYYGSSFGFRPMIEYFPLFALLLLFSMKLFKPLWTKILFVAVCGVTVYVNQTQAYQYRKFILHWDKMSEYKYWKIFMKTEDKWIGFVWDNAEAYDISGDELAFFNSGFESPSDGWNGIPVYDVGDSAHSGNKVTGVLPDSIYSSTLIIKRDETINRSTKPAITVIGYIHPNGQSHLDSLKLAVSFHSSDGKAYYYKDRYLGNFHKDKNGWWKFEIGMTLNQIQSLTDDVKLYFWNPEKKSYWVDDVEVRVINQYY